MAGVAMMRVLILISASAFTSIPPTDTLTLPPSALYNTAPNENIREATDGTIAGEVLAYSTDETGAYYPGVATVWVWRPDAGFLLISDESLLTLTKDGRTLVTIWHLTEIRVRTLDQLYAQQATTTRSADFDHDGDVDMSDFGMLQACLGRVVPSCRQMDLNNSGVIDGTDIEELDRQMTAFRMAWVPPVIDTQPEGGAATQGE